MSGLKMIEGKSTSKFKRRKSTTTRPSVFKLLQLFNTCCLSEKFCYYIINCLEGDKYICTVTFYSS